MQPCGAGYNTGMQIQQNVALSNYSTMRLGGLARYLIEVHSREELSEAVTWASKRSLSIIMIGGGSNIVWRDKGFDGVVFVNRIMGYEEVVEDEKQHLLTIGAGENWDKVVACTVQDGLTGIEALSLIPGTAGATPIQNVGAYGQEIAQTLVDVNAYDLQTRQFMTIPAADCEFGYRSSRFKTTDHGRFLITAIHLRLTRANPSAPFYAAVQRYFEEHGIHKISPQVLRDAVVAIRRSKLPDPVHVANNGSFFANPVVDQALFDQIKINYPDVVCWPVANGQVKLSAAWLLEQAGFKDYHDPATGMATWPAQPLVLVNEHAKHTADLLSFRQKIINAVQQKFRVTLEQEPELLP